MKSQVKNSRGQADQKLKLLEGMRDKVRVLSEEVREEEEKKTNAMSDLKILKEKISNMQFKLNNNAKAMDTCVREREVLAQNHLSKIESIKNKEAALKIKTSTLKNIKNEHQGYLISIRNLTKIIEELKNEKQQHEMELNKRIIQKHRALEIVAQREIEINKYQATILKNESILRQQLNLIEVIRSERNNYRKLLIEQQNEMFEYRRKFAYLSQQVKQLKTEIEDKNQAIVFEHFNLQNVKEDIDLLESQNSSTLSQLQKADSIINTQREQIKKLTQIIHDADEELKVQVKQYNNIVNEQRVLNGQLVQRNDELAKLYENLKLQNSVLIKSANFYAEKQNYLIDLEREKTIGISTLNEVLKDLNKYTELKDTISLIETELTKEQFKVKALLEELKKPINIHRWRRLMDTDTTTYNMLQSVHKLQKEIITKQEKIQAKESEIQNKEKLYIELRKVIARQPGTEATEQLHIYMEQLQEKKEKLKQLDNELKIYNNKTKELQFSLEKLDSDLKLLKLAYFQKKRKQQKALELAQSTFHPSQHGGGRGGGQGGQGGGQGGGQSHHFDDEEDLPDILKPTQFPTYQPLNADQIRAQIQHQANHMDEEEQSQTQRQGSATFPSSSTLSSPSMMNESKTQELNNSFPSPPMSAASYSNISLPTTARGYSSSRQVEEEKSAILSHQTSHSRPMTGSASHASSSSNSRNNSRPPSSSRFPAIHNGNQSNRNSHQDLQSSDSF